MIEPITLHYDVPGDDFTRAGEASSAVKKTLRKLGVSGEVIRKVAIAMYEGEINMVIHGGGGTADVFVSPDSINMVLADEGPGIENLELAMKEGYSTASDEVRSLGFGAGMGLPNMRKYSDTMVVDTKVGVGTTVTMTVALV